MNEIWKDIPGYEGLYQVSNYGQVKSLISNIIMKPNVLPNGYTTVHLRKNGHRKALYIHRLVAMAFIPNPMGLSEVDHIDSCKSNNTAENLQWLTGADNTRKAKGKAIIRTDQNGNAVYYETLMDAVREGFNKRSIWRCLKGLRKTHRGYSWEYA